MLWWCGPIKADTVISGIPDAASRIPTEASMVQAKLLTIFIAEMTGQLLCQGGTGGHRR